MIRAALADDDVLARTVLANWDGWRAHLHRLAVREDLRGRGLGRRLVEAAGRRLIALGAARVDAMVLDGNDLGHRPWPALGRVSQPGWTRWVRHL